MGKTKEVAWRSTDTLPKRKVTDTPPKKKVTISKPLLRYRRRGTLPAPVQYLDSGSGSDSDKSDDNDELSLDNDNDDGEVELLDPEKEECDLVDIVSPVSDSSSLNMMGKTKESDCSNTDTLKKRDVNITKIQQKDPNPKTPEMIILDSDSESDDDRNGYNTGTSMGEIRECGWQNADTPNKKLKQSQKLLDDDDDDGGDVELLDPKQEECELVENVVDCVEKLSSSQSDTVCVQGYQVKPSNAPILKVILKKHGDIAAGCVFEADMRSTLLDVVCEVVRQIHTSNIIERMEEIESRVSHVEATKVDVTWLRAHFQKKMKLFKNTNLLLETKKSTILAKCAARKDLREAEKRVEVLVLIEKNINDAFMESKGELDSLLQQELL